MRKLTTMLFPAILCCATLAVAADLPASGPGSHGTRGGNLVLAQNDGPSLSEAIEQVKRQYNGRIVSAETRISGKREVHHIKVLTEDGKVKTVRISGRIRS